MPPSVQGECPPAVGVAGSDKACLGGCQWRYALSDWPSNSVELCPGGWAVDARCSLPLYYRAATKKLNTPKNCLCEGLTLIIRYQLQYGVLRWGCACAAPGEWPSMRRWWEFRSSCRTAPMWYAHYYYQWLDQAGYLWAACNQSRRRM